eukprot:5234800-Amphidinium_carterae.2
MDWRSVSKTQLAKSFGTCAIGDVPIWVVVVFEMPFHPKHRSNGHMKAIAMNYLVSGPSTRDA